MSLEMGIGDTRHWHDMGSSLEPHGHVIPAHPDAVQDIRSSTVGVHVHEVEMLDRDDDEMK